MKTDLMPKFVHMHQHAHTYVNIWLVWIQVFVCVLVLTVVNVEWVGLQYVSVISACSVAQRCGNSV